MGRIGLGDFKVLKSGESLFLIFPFGLIINDDTVKVEGDPKLVVVSVVFFGLLSARNNPPAGQTLLDRIHDVFPVGAQKKRYVKGFDGRKRRLPGSEGTGFDGKIVVAAGAEKALTGFRRIAA